MGREANLIVDVELLSVQKEMKENYKYSSYGIYKYFILIEMNKF
jgi:hypothetical protein